MMTSLEGLQALDAYVTDREQAEAERLRLKNRALTRGMERKIANAPQWAPGAITRLPGEPDPNQPTINSFWSNARRMGQIGARGLAGTGVLPGGGQILGHVGPTMEGIGGAERAQAVLQPGMAAWQADDIRRKAMAGLKGARG
jgi:hypothetical protein